MHSTLNALVSQLALILPDWLVVIILNKILAIKLYNCVIGKVEGIFHTSWIYSTKGI